MNTEVSMLEVFSHTALKGVVVLAVALMFGLLLHRLAAARRYAVWITAVGALALLPPAMLLLPAWRVLPHADKTVIEWPEPTPEEIIESHEPVYLPMGTKMTSPASAYEAPPAGPAAVPPAPSPKLSWQEIAGFLPHLWLAISTLLLLRLAWGAARLRRLEHTLKPGTCDLLAKVAQEMNLKGTPRLLIGTGNAVPMVWGVWRPRLLLPCGFESWSREKLRGVLLHELAHLKRRDPLALWTAQWVKAFHWFNPLAWLTLRQLRADQERACDDTVLRHGVRPSDYAQHLLDLSRHTRLAPGLSLCALTITRCAPVESRVKAILDPKRSREGLTARWLLSLAGLALLTTLPVAMLHAIEGPKMRGRMLDRNGVVLAETTEKKMRYYPLKALTAHVTGYAGKNADLALMKGYSSLEATHNATLNEGKDLDLSIDARIQSLVLRTMQDAGYTRGAAVVLEPRTGEILASVSLPVYDPNIMVPSISEKNWDALIKNTDSPLLDRCNGGRFAPGSAFMPLTALAGISKEVGSHKFNCTGSVTYGSRAFQCWKSRVDGQGHGPLGMPDAISNSCSCYWYQFGNQAGVDAIGKVGHLVGFGENFNITHEGMSGTLPTPEWMAKERPNERWTAGHTANLAIGQGSLTATPLHMAVLAATVAQRGRVPQPTFLRIKDAAEAKVRADLAAEGFAADQMEQLREGMRQAVNKDGGTGKGARSEKVIIAGKTGTAQGWRKVEGKQVADNNTWFIGFAPYDNPTLAFAILKQGGKSGGHDCAPLAKRIVEETLALPADGSGEVRPVETAWKRAEPPAAKSKDLRAEMAALILRFKQNQDKIKALEKQLSTEPFAALDQQRERLVQEKQALYEELAKAVPKPESKIIAASKMRFDEQERWNRLRTSEGLPEMPAEATMVATLKGERLLLPPFSDFKFMLPKETARRWLLAAMSKREQEGYKKELQWPAHREAFQRVYYRRKGGSIQIRSEGGDSVEVIIWKAEPLIAPDEASPPRPKTAAPRELEGVANVNGEMSNPS